MQLLHPMIKAPSSVPQCNATAAFIQVIPAVVAVTVPHTHSDFIEKEEKCCLTYFHTNTVTFGKASIQHVCRYKCDALHSEVGRG